MAADLSSFPSGFVWGAATAAYQIEGAHDADGKGESIWDRFAHTPGKVANGDTGDVACDHYHRYREDVDLMRELGLRAYRFSVSWPRVLPTGSGAANAAGLDFYDRLVDVLLAAGIRPFVTLYHWDLPQALEEAGGWPSRETIEHFRDYAVLMVERLGDRVKDWITHNEPFVAAYAGYRDGRHAPGRQDLAAAIQAAHNLLVSHGEATRAMRQCRPGLKVGITLNLTPMHPASYCPEDQAATRRQDGFLNRWFLDPVLRGGYPADMLEFYGPLAPKVSPGDLEMIRQEIDFLGVNYYTRNVVKADPEGGFLKTRLVPPRGPGHEYTEMDWEIYAAGLHELLVRLKREYGVRRLYVTENGIACRDVVEPSGEVDDPDRLRYLREHLAAAHRAIQDGVPLAGYFVWSLLDNFEWAHGYTKRFGVVHVDYATQRRTPKSSAKWYRQAIVDGGFGLS